MKAFEYFVIGFIVFIIVVFLSSNIAGAIGAGPYEIGVVVVAISILCSIVVICTLVIVDTIKDMTSK